MSSALIVDDDRGVLLTASSALCECDIRVETAQSGEEALSRFESPNAGEPDLVLLDLVLPEIDGLQVLQRIREHSHSIPVIMMTATGTNETAIEAMKLGAKEFLTKPLDIGHLKTIVQRHLARSFISASTDSRSETVICPEEQSDPFIGRSNAMQQVFKDIGRVAQQDTTVLIRGESGTGKELVARAIWNHSARSDNPMLTLNCAAFTPTLLESELFGHERGAFTGATQRHRGKFEQCDGGTMFLDEVGDMHSSVQAKVLRVLQDQRFERIGGDTTLATDVRIISATNCDLDDLSRSKLFRDDLFHRLATYKIEVPPLRERGDDVRLLVQHYLARFNRKLSTHIEAISADASEALLRYSWPGNVRELQTVLSQAMLNAPTQVIAVQDLPSRFLRKRVSQRPSHDSNSIDSACSGPTEDPFAMYVNQALDSGSNNIYANALSLMERSVLKRVMEAANGNQTKAAERLGITRGSLRHKLRALGITIDHSVRIPRTSNSKT